MLMFGSSLVRTAGISPRCKVCGGERCAARQDHEAEVTATCLGLARCALR